MKKVGERLGWLRIAVLLWASLWMLAIPLFHVHPAVNHRHGGAVHAYGVTVHTVLSVDLDGEFDDHHDVDPSEESASRLSLFDHHSHSWDQHPEIEFSLLNESSERKAFKPFFTSALALETSPISRIDTQVRTEAPALPVRVFRIFVHHLPSRAPPLFLS